MIASAEEKAARKSRAYALPSHANPGKEAAIRNLLPDWQRGLVHVQLIQSRAMRAGEKLALIDTKTLPGYLSQRQWKSIVNQVNAALRSWQALMVIAMREWINEQEIADDKERRRLYTLNKSKKWWGEPTLEPAVVKFMRSTLPLPNLSRVRTMLMDGPIAQIEAPRNESSPFEAWVRVSLQPGTKSVRIPLGANPYEQDADGERARVVQVTVPISGPTKYSLVKHSPIVPIRDTTSRNDADLDDTVLGIDWGLTTLVTTSDGRRLGQALYAWLKERDVELLALTKALQEAKIPFNSSKRYRNLQRRIRDYVRNEIGRILNTLAAEDITEFVVEKLDFRHGGLSKRMNRILTRAGRAAFKTKLASLKETHGIITTEVNPAHTSRECTGCGYASEKNRPTQARFRCGFCGKTMHADINAARVVKQRRSLPNAGLRMSKRQVLTHLDKQFTTRWGVDASQVRERHERPNSRATPHHTVAGSTSSVEYHVLQQT